MGLPPGTATRVKGSRPGIADTWKPAAAQEAPSDEAAPAETPGTGSTADAGQSADESAGGAADADEAGKALAAGNLDVALAALETARDLAAHGRSGRGSPASS